MNFNVSAWCAVAVCLSGLNVEAQENYYRLPMNIPLSLSANFAELRSGHFHSGIDIKTGGVEGQKVYSAADGYISRIGIAPGGYGRVVYIAHPNGTTTVYGHLKEFNADIEAYVRKERYRRHKNAVDLYPDKSLFPVVKGAFIGLSGNSGMSFGPHLHYEIRESGRQDPLNPIKSGGIAIKDNIPPTVYNLYWITVDTVLGVPVHNKRLTVKPRNVSAGKYVVDMPLKVSGQGYFAVEYTDTKNGVSNKFGVYRASLSVDRVKQFEFVADRFSFGQTKYVNEAVAYDLHQKSSHDVMRFVRPCGNPLSMYKCAEAGGLLNCVGESGAVIELEDDFKNVTEIAFNIIGEPDKKIEVAAPENMRVVANDKNFSMSTEKLTVTIPAGTLYEPVFYTQFRTDPIKLKDENVQVVSDFFVVGNDDVPMLSSYLIAIECSLPVQMQRYATIAKVDDSGLLSCIGGKWRDGKITASSSKFGKYCVVLDTLPPKVRSMFEDGADLSSRKSVTFGLSDDLSGVAAFEATIDGKWIILEQNMVKGTITHYFDKELLGSTGEHVFVLKLTDDRGNVNIVERRFKY